jgi:ABC-type Fe3+/spermidine/putrescine transport system ATPase subunit
MSKVEIVGINKSFDKKQVLKDVNLTVEDGEIISLLGPSGCGKSTTLKIISGIVKPDSGDVLFNGSTIQDTPIEKRGAIIVFQEHLLFPHLNLEENIGFGLKMAGVSKKEIKQRVKETLKLLELEGFEKRYPNELSGGQQQRAAIGRALILKPKVLLLDEPFSSLDIKVRNSMRELVLSLHRELKITTILVTHDKEEALMMSNRIALMLDGSILQYDTPENIYERPVSQKAADFLGEKNYIEGKIENQRFLSQLISFNVKAMKAGVCKLMFKPEDVSLSSTEVTDTIEGTIVNRIYGGERSLYVVACRGEQKFKCLTWNNENYSIGSKVYLSFNKEKVIFYYI